MENHWSPSKHALYSVWSQTSHCCIALIFILGISLVHAPNAQVTHHLTSTYTATPLLAASLLSACHFVKPEWLQELIKDANLPNDTSNQSFALPAVHKYRPAFSPSLSPIHKVFKVWEPNEERLNLLANIRFVCVGEKGREIESDLREVINRGSGSIETFEVHGGKAKWHKALTRGQAKGGKKLVLVGDEKAIKAAVGQNGWTDLAAEAKA